MWRLARSVAHLLHWWWRRDRIRAFPSEGRLLRLAPPALLRIAGEPVRVLSRDVCWDAGATCILHRCESAAGDFELRVWLTRGAPVIQMRRCGHAWAVAAPEVEVITGTA